MTKEEIEKRAREYIVEKVEVLSVNDWTTDYKIINSTYVQCPIIRAKEALAAKTQKE